MGFKISERDGAAVARLKLIYLVPVFLVTLVPICLWIGFREYGTDGFRLVLSVVRRGKC